MLKKILAMLIVLAMVFALAACGGKNTIDTPSETDTNVESIVESEATDTTGSEAANEETASQDTASTGLTSMDTALIESTIVEDGASQNATSQDVISGTTPSQGTNPNATASQNVVSQTTNPNATTSQNVVSQTTTTSQNANATVSQTVSKAPTQQGTVSQGVVASQTASQGVASQNAVSQTVAPQSTPNATVSQTVSKAPTQQGTVSQGVVASQTASQGGMTITTGSKVEANTPTTSQPTINITSNAGTATNQSGQANITAAYNDLKVSTGTSVTEGLDFGGKTFTMAITEEGQYLTGSFKRTITAFEKKFNCKIKTVQYPFSKYNQQVAQAKSAGKVPEICYAHGSMFPSCAIDGLYNNFDDILKTGDLMDNDDPTAGGVDLAKTSYFVYDKKIYGLCNYESCFPVVIYYNKIAMADAGFSGNKDPRKMAESGKWTWNTILQMGQKLTNSSEDVYFLSNGFSGRSIMLAYGAPIITLENGKYSQNVTSTGYIAGLELIKQMFRGAKAIAEPRGNDGAFPYNSYDRMLKGKTYMFTEETSKYLDMAKDVKNSSAFQRNKANIGITTMPLGNTNTKKLYPTGWLTAVCSGKGTDARVALAWEVFRSSYVDPTVDTNAMSEVDQAFVDGLLKGGICCEVGNFSTSSDDAVGMMMQAAVSITNGADISQTITSIKDKMTLCINTTMKQ